MKGAKKDVRAARKRGKAKESETPANTQVELAGTTRAGYQDKSPEMDQSVAEREVLTGSPEETFELGRSIAGELTAPAVILLSGDLGAGKTVMAKGIAAGLDIDPADVTSPSFTLINIHQGRLRLYHVDLYRLDSASCAGLGLEEMFEDPQGVIVIEWAERLPAGPQGAVRVRIEYVTDISRRVLVSAGSG